MSVHSFDASRSDVISSEQAFLRRSPLPPPHPALSPLRGRGRIFSKLNFFSSCLRSVHQPVPQSAATQRHRRMERRRISCTMVHRGVVLGQTADEQGRMDGRVAFGARNRVAPAALHSDHVCDWGGFHRRDGGRGPAHEPRRDVAGAPVRGVPDARQGKAGGAGRAGFRSGRAGLACFFRAQCPACRSNSCAKTQGINHAGPPVPQSAADNPASSDAGRLRLRRIAAIFGRHRPATRRRIVHPLHQ